MANKKEMDRSLDLERSSVLTSETADGKKGKRIRFRSEDIVEETPYYLQMGRRYKFAKFAILVVLVVYLLGMLSAFRDELTLTNFLQWFDKMFVNSYTVSEYEGEYKTIFYNNDGSGDQTLYKGDLAVVDEGGLVVYSMSGIAEMTEAFSYSAPKLLSSDRYLLAYDFFGNSYSVYNSFSRLHTETLPYPISGAAISDSGIFALISRTDEYRGSVTFYNAKFEPLSEILKSKFVFDVAIDHDGDMAIITSVYNEGGDFMCEIVALDPHSDEPRSTVNIADTVPWKTGFMINGNYAVVCDSAVYLYDTDHKQIGCYTYGGVALSSCYIDDYFTTIVLSENVVVDENRVVFYKADGEKLREIYTKGEIADIKTDDRYAYLVFDGSIMKIDLYTGEEGFCRVEKNCGKILLIKDMLLLCYANHESPIENSAVTFGMSGAADSESASGEESSLMPTETDFIPSDTVIPDSTDTADTDTAAS